MGDWYRTTFDVIDTRSFSSLWYWILLVLVWSGASHYVLGIPYDLVMRARQEGGETERDLFDLVRVNVNRSLRLAQGSGLWLLAVFCFVLTSLGLLGFVYGIEVSQAIFLIVLPLAVVAGTSLRTARRIHAADGAGVYGMLQAQRFLNQFIGLIAIFVTAFWGMWKTLAAGIL